MGVLMSCMDALNALLSRNITTNLKLRKLPTTRFDHKELKRTRAYAFTFQYEREV